VFTSIEKWTQYSTTLNASNNTYYDSTTANPFKVVNGKMVNLSGWQSSVQSDYSSTWQSPVISPVAARAAPAPTLTDFSVNVDSNVYTMSAAKATVTARVNSFAYGPVNLQVSGLPSGVTAAISQTSMTSGVATITLSAAPTATTQKVPVTLWDVSGSRVHSVTLYVNVSAT
jgi:hypothetical protein